jgi:hypothetical protein
MEQKYLRTNVPLHKSACPGSAKANGREPKTDLGQVFNFKLGCFDDEYLLIYMDTRPHL